MMENKGRINEQTMDSTLRYICLTITSLTLGMMMIRFFTKGAFHPSGIEALYIGVLSTYSVHRKTLQFSEKIGDTKRPDQLFVCIWFAITTILYVINFLSNGYFCPSGDMKILNQMTRITLEVAGIFVLSNGANMIKEKRKEKKK